MNFAGRIQSLKYLGKRDWFSIKNYTTVCLFNARVRLHHNLPLSSAIHVWLCLCGSPLTFYIRSS